MDKYLLHNAIKLNDVNNQIVRFSQIKGLGTSIFSDALPSERNQATLSSLLRIKFDEKSLANNVISLDTLTGFLKGLVIRIRKVGQCIRDLRASADP